MEELVGIFAIFCIFIALPWMVLHFLSKHRATIAAAAGDPKMNHALASIADKLEKRLDSIETLLDHEVPGWRNRRAS